MLTTLLWRLLLFSSKRCEQLICHLLPQNCSPFIRVSNPLATRKFCMVRWLMWWVIWAGSYLSNSGNLAFHPCLWIKTNWQCFGPFCWQIMYQWRTSPYYSTEGLLFCLFSPRQATLDTSEAARRLCWSLIAPAITARAVWAWGLPWGPRGSNTAAGGDGNIAAPGKEATLRGPCPEKGGPCVGKMAECYLQHFHTPGLR